MANRTFDVAAWVDTAIADGHAVPWSAGTGDASSYVLDADDRVVNRFTDSRVRQAVLDEAAARVPEQRNPR